VNFWIETDIISNVHWVSNYRHSYTRDQFLGESRWESIYTGWEKST